MTREEKEKLAASIGVKYKGGRGKVYEKPRPIKETMKKL